MTARELMIIYDIIAHNYEMAKSRYDNFHHQIEDKYNTNWFEGRLSKDEADEYHEISNRYEKAKCAYNALISIDVSLQ